jgi:hypothetical protein
MSNSTAHNPLTERLIRSDFVQIATLYFALLLFVLLATWPSVERPNNSWFILTQARMIALTFLALSYGAGSSNKGVSEQRSTVLALVLLAALSLPLEVASYAASYPTLSLFWSFGITLLDTLALFGLGLALGQVLTYLRLRGFMSIVVVAVLVGLLSIDQLLAFNLFNPLIAVHSVSPLHLGVMAVIAILTLWQLFQRKDRHDSAQPTTQT